MSDYTLFMNRSDYEVYLAIMDKLGVKLEVIKDLNDRK